MQDHGCWPFEVKTEICDMLSSIGVRTGCMWMMNNWMGRMDGEHPSAMAFAAISYAPKTHFGCQDCIVCMDFKLDE